MSWFRTHAGGENSEFDVNIDCVECAEYRLLATMIRGTERTSSYT